MPSEELWISESALSQIISLADHFFPYETGGMLLGYQAENNEAVVTCVIGPGPKAKHSCTRFVPDAEYQQEKLEDHFRRTDGRETYLGDWHSHPSGTTELSFLDKRTLARIASTPSSGTVKPIMAILAGERKSWKLGAARFLRAKRRLVFTSHDLMLLMPHVYVCAELTSVVPSARLEST